jgi:GH24 family phage-related lysozyme (muramidase)
MKKQILSLGLALLLLMESASLPLLASSDAADSADTSVSQESDSTAESQDSQPGELADEDYTHEISEAGLELIKGFEGYIRYAYWDYKQYSIGYGSYVESPDVYPDGITEREASDLLKRNLEDTAVYLNNFLVKYKIRLNQNQFDALMSFSYNLGKYTWTKEDHTLRNLIISQDYTPEELTETFGLYCHAGGKRLEALYKRRMREAAIFLSEYNLSDPDADLYVVNVTDSLSIREQASTTSTKLGSVKSSKIIRVHEYSSDGKWGFTSYNGYFGWVSLDYLVSINEEESVTFVDETGHDDCKIHYVFDEMTMTATVGGDEATNSSHYTGEYGGDVYLTKYLLYNGSIFILKGISDTAFTKCYTIQSIYIPPNVTEIGANAFAESTLQTIYYTDGSYAKTYAKDSPFEAIDERCKGGHTAGAWKVTVKASSSRAQVEERTCSVCKDVLSRTHVGIEIVTEPSKTEYKEGIAFKQDGLTVQILYSDGSTVMTKDFTVTGYNKNKLGTQTLTVKYSIFTDTFTVNVSQKSLTKITITQNPTKLSYIEGQAFSKTGLTVMAHYDNNTTATVKAANCEVTGYDPNKIGTQTLTVTYNGKTATFQVTVRAKQLTAIQIVDYPNTLEYFCGEEFDRTGLRVKLFYDNDTTEIVDERYVDIVGYDKTVAGTQTLQVVYKQMSQSFPVTVILNYLKSDELRISDPYLAGVAAGITVGELRKQIESGDRIEVLKNGKVLSDTDRITTGLTVRLLYNGKEQDTATLVVAGDLTGDGNCTVVDFLMLSDYLMGNYSLNEIATIAGDLDGDGYLTLADYCALYPLTQLTRSANTL